MTIDAASTLARWFARACRSRHASSFPLFSRAFHVLSRVRTLLLGASLGGAVALAQAAPAPVMRVPDLHVPAALQALLAPPATPASDVRAASGVGPSGTTEDDAGSGTKRTAKGAKGGAAGVGADAGHAGGDDRNIGGGRDAAGDDAAPDDAARARAARAATRDAVLAGSLDRVIATLESDRQRAARLAQLRQLRAATREARGAAAMQAGVPVTGVPTAGSPTAGLPAA
ncbi:MAG: hypothetical protein ACRYGL_05300, partial [Janthinobacterium lividum]